MWPHVNTQIEAAIRVTQNNDAAVMYGLAAAKIMERVVLVSERLVCCVCSAAAICLYLLNFRS